MWSHADDEENRERTRGTKDRRREKEPKGGDLGEEGRKGNKGEGVYRRKGAKDVRGGAARIYRSKAGTKCSGSARDTPTVASGGEKKNLNTLGRFVRLERRAGFTLTWVSTATSAGAVSFRPKSQLNTSPISTRADPKLLTG